MPRSVDRPRRALASLWPRWFWRAAAEPRPVSPPQPRDHLDEYLQLLDYLDDLCRDAEVTRVDVSSTYLSLLDAPETAARLHRRQRRFAAFGVRVTFSPQVPRHQVRLHTGQRP